MSVERAILLADVSGSTPLYRKYGDAEASRMVFDCVAGMQRIATERGGDFVRSKGDDVLCLFETADQAVGAARQILDHGVQGAVSIHAGLHWGQVLWHGDELFGDAVNVAARLSSQAKDNEVLISRMLVDRASSGHATDLRSMGEITLRGTDVPTEVFALLAAASGAADEITMMTPQPTLFNAQRKEQVAGTMLRLWHENWTQDLPEGSGLNIGRSPQCDLVMPQEWVSRLHAVISVRGGIVEFKDSSSAGSTLKIGEHPEFFLRRQTIALTGNGLIELGNNSSGQDLPKILFQVMQVH